jgi:hypothetical protein
MRDSETLSRIVLIGIVFGIVTMSVARGQEAPAPAPAKLTFQGDTALWSVAIRPDKTADFEQVMRHLHDALTHSSQPTRQQQATGWRVVRMSTPLPDGNVVYVHLVHPVITGADYTVMQILYDEMPDRRQELYELYRGAFAKNLSLATGTTVPMSPLTPKEPPTSESR